MRMIKNYIKTKLYQIRKNATEEQRKEIDMKINRIKEIRKVGAVGKSAFLIAIVLSFVAFIPYILGKKIIKLLKKTFHG